jgi:hypothetical protein
MKAKIWILILILTMILSSCYYRELVYSFNRSGGGVYEDNSCYYLAQVKEFRRPKGISRFPDGGTIKELRQLFGFFRTDTLADSTEVVAVIRDLRGWPSRFKTRIENNGTDITIGIANISFPDSVNGIYFYNLKSERFYKYSEKGVFPTLSKTGTRIAYCKDTILSVENYSDRSLISTYTLDTEPVYICWEDENIILLFCSDPFRVMELDLNSGKVNSTDMEYIRNYNQEAGIMEINRLTDRSSPDLKMLLDKYE